MRWHLTARILGGPGNDESEAALPGKRPVSELSCTKQGTHMAPAPALQGRQFMHSVAQQAFKCSISRAAPNVPAAGFPVHGFHALRMTKLLQHCHHLGCFHINQVPLTLSGWRTTWPHHA